MFYLSSCNYLCNILQYRIGPRYNGTWLYIDGLVQDCGISSALAMEVLQACT